MYSIGSLDISKQQKKMLDRHCRYNRTVHEFDSWLILPPAKPGEGLLVPHTAVFFTSDLDFSKEAGEKIAKIAISSVTQKL